MPRRPRARALGVNPSVLLPSHLLVTLPPPPPSSTAAQTTVSAPWISPLVWQLRPGTASLGELFPDLAGLPASIQSPADLQRAQRVLLTSQLASCPPAWDDVAPVPLSSDYRAMVRAYPLEAGDSKVDSGFAPHIGQWRTLHAASCSRCATRADPSCEGQRIIDVLERGWRMRWTDRPPKQSVAPPKSTRDAAQLWKATSDLVRQGKIFEIEPVPSAARCFAVSKKRFSEAARSAIPWLEDPACAIPIFQPGLKRRMVFDFRRSRANSVSLRWPLRLPPLAATARICRRDHWLASADLKAGYLQVPYAASDWREPCSTAARLAFAVADPTGVIRTFAPRFLMFGSNSAGSMFCAFSALLSSIVEPILVARGHAPDSHVVWVDDWLFSAPSEAAANRMLDDFLDVCKRLGVVVNADKVVRATQRIHWLGLDVDTPSRRFLLAPARVAQVRAEATRLLRFRHRCRTAAVRRFAGLACWCSFVVPGSRPYTVALCSAGQQRRHVQPLSALCCDDLRFWQNEGTWRGYLDGMPMLQPAQLAFCSFVSDAGAHAAGAHTATKFAWRAFSAAEQATSSTTRELLAIEMALRHLCDTTRNRIVVVGSDNAAAVLAANSGKCGRANSDSIPVVRRMGAWAAARGVHLVGVWIPRSINRLSDALAACTSLPQAADVFARALRAHSSARAAAAATVRPARS